MGSEFMPRNALPARRFSLILLAAATLLAACAEDPILPGERFPVRPDEAPLSVADRARVGAVRIPAPLVNAEWTHRNGAAGGRLVNPAFAAQPQLRWLVDIGEGDGRRRRILTGPIVAGGLIFTIDAAGQLSAVTTQGQIAWTQSLVPEGQVADTGPGGGFAYDRGVLYVTTGFGEVRAVSPATGNIIWSQTFEGPIRAAPTVADGRVFVVVRNDTAYALDTMNGVPIWRAQGVGGAGLFGGASPATDGDLVVLPFASGEVLGLIARNGLQVWGTAVTGGRRGLARNSINDISGDPVIDGETVYASNQSGRTISIERQSGARNWTISEGSYGPAWPVGGSVFLLSDEGGLLRVEAETGQLVWQVALPQYFNEEKRIEAIPHYGPILAGGRLWVAGGDELLRAYNPNDGAPLGTVALPGGAGSAPAIAGGVMYVVNREGQLLAFQ